MPYTSKWIMVPYKYGYNCHACKSNNVEHRVWESSCGGHEDIKYRCRDCGHVWWVEGSDA